MLYEMRICTLTIGGDEYLTIYGGEAVLHNGEVLGRLRSGGYGYSLKKNIGYAYLPNELAKTGTPLEVDVFGERIPSRVAPDVLYDPKGERLRV